MRKILPGYFSPTRKDLDDIWTKGLIVPDANILLHLLRYGQETRKQIFDTLKAFKPRVWIPHQVALEFSRNWRTVDADNRAAYEELKSQIQAQGRSLASVFDSVVRFQIIDTQAEKKKVDTLVEQLCASLDSAAKKHPSVNESETIADEIGALVESAIGASPSPEKISEWTASGEARYAKQIPPGYKDESKGSDGKFGDYFVWEEMIEQAKAKSADVVFLSDDRKDDWVQRYRGKDIGPRPELVQEFWERTGRKFHSYSLTSFLEYAKKYTKIDVTRKAIDEVQSVRDQVVAIEQAKQLERAHAETAHRLLNSRRARYLRSQIEDQREVRNRLAHEHRALRVSMDELEKSGSLSEQELLEFREKSDSLRHRIARVEREMRYLNHELRDLERTLDGSASPNEDVVRKQLSLLREGDVSKSEQYTRNYLAHAFRREANEAISHPSDREREPTKDPFHSLLSEDETDD